MFIKKAGLSFAAQLRRNRSAGRPDDIYLSLLQIEARLQRPRDTVRYFKIAIATKHNGVTSATPRFSDSSDLIATKESR